MHRRLYTVSQSSDQLKVFLSILGDICKIIRIEDHGLNKSIAITGLQYILYKLVKPSCSQKCSTAVTPYVQHDSIFLHFFYVPTQTPATAIHQY